MKIINNSRESASFNFWNPY